MGYSSGQLVIAPGVLSVSGIWDVASSRYQVSVAASWMVLGSYMRSVCIRAYYMLYQDEYCFTAENKRISAQSAAFEKR